jgi:drug/metabolite transporter (DMT)-like permease
MPVRREQSGLALCLLSAAGFGAMAIFAKVAFRAGFDVGTLLDVRFALAAAVMWGIVAVRRPAWPDRRGLLTALGLGALGYSVQAALFFGAVRRMDASLASLLLYTYPALVAATAIALRRERASRRRLAALGLASGGAVLVLVGGGTGAIQGTGALFAFGAAVAYTAYILVADRAVRAVDPFLMTALIVTGAAATVWIATLAEGGPLLAVGAAGWLAVAGTAIVSTVVPATAFLLGLARVGPSTAAIVSTFEPVVTVTLAVLLLGDRLHAWQLLGGVLVLAAVVAINARREPATAPAAAA